VKISVLAVSLFLILAPAALLRPAQGVETGAISGTRAAPADPAMASFTELMAALAALCGGAGGGFCGSAVATIEAIVGFIGALISDVVLALWVLCNSICGLCSCFVFCSGLSVSAVIYAITDLFISCGAWICALPSYCVSTCESFIAALTGLAGACASCVAADAVAAIFDILDTIASGVWALLTPLYTLACDAGLAFWNCVNSICGLGGVLGICGGIIGAIGGCVGTIFGGGSCIGAILDFIYAATGLDLWNIFSWILGWFGGAGWGAIGGAIAGCLMGYAISLVSGGAVPCFNVCCVPVCTFVGCCPAIVGGILGALSGGGVNLLKNCACCY